MSRPSERAASGPAQTLWRCGNASSLDCCGMTNSNFGLRIGLLFLAFAATAPARASAQGAPVPAPASGQQAAASDQGPTEIRYKGVTFVPGGFLEAAAIYRSA